MKESPCLIKWTRAANDLGIEFVSPFRLLIAGESFEFDAIVPQFGSPNGMLIMLDYQPRLAQVAKDSGYAFSCLFENDDPYEMEHFVDVLNDWGWGRKDVVAPAWYSGAPWCA